MSFALGINMSFGRMGSAIGGIILPIFYNLGDESLFLPLICAALSCCFSLSTTILICYIDKLSDIYIEYKKANESQ